MLLGAKKNKFELREVTASAIHEELARIHAAGGDTFVLYKGIQAEGIEMILAEPGPDLYYTLEHMENGKTYVSVEAYTPIEKVVETFQKYLNDDPAWRHDFAWTEKGSGKAGCLGMAAFLIAGALALAVL